MNKISQHAMGGHQAFALLAAAIFVLVAVGHVLRLALGWTVTIGPWTMPLWVSVVGFLVPAALAVLLWREARGR